MPDHDERDAKAQPQPVTQKPVSDDDKPGWGPLPAEKKRWETPKVIVSAMRNSEAKGPAPTAELSPFFSPDTGTVNS